jgi:hypothetical protein
VWVNVFLVATFCVWYFGVATLYVVETRYVGWKFPAVKKTPIDLRDLSISQAAGRKLSYFGYEFEVPWDDLDDGKTKQAGNMQLIVFRSGNVILFSRAAPKEFVQTFLSSTKIDADNFRKLCGDGALESDYSLQRLILEATPGQVNLLTQRADAARGAMLLVMKGVMIPRGGESGIFRVQNEKFQGFQFGDPQSRPKMMSVEIFAENAGLNFIFAQKEKGTTPAITQAEINRVIQTARKAPVEELSTSRWTLFQAAAVVAFIGATPSSIFGGESVAEGEESGFRIEVGVERERALGQTIFAGTKAL